MNCVVCGNPYIKTTDGKCSECVSSGEIISQKQRVGNEKWNDQLDEVKRELGKTQEYRFIFPLDTGFG